MIIIRNYMKHIVREAIRGVGAQSVTVNAKCPVEEMEYLIFVFLRSCVEAKCGVKFRHSTCNASRIKRKIGNGMFMKK